MLSSISGSLDSFVYRKKSILITVPCNSLLPFSFLEIGQSSIIWPKGRNLVVALFIVIIRVCAYNMLLIRDQGGFKVAIFVINLRSNSSIPIQFEVTPLTYGPTANNVSIQSLFSVVFRYGWNFEYHKGEPPASNVLWLNDTGSYIAIAFRPKHITHFAESVNLLLLTLLAPEGFPTVVEASSSHL